MASLCHLEEHEVAAKLPASRVSFQETTDERSKTNKQGQEKNLTSPTLNEEELAKTYSKHASINYSKQNYFEAQKSEQRALEIKVRLFGDEHQSTADSYQTLGRAQHALGDFSSALQSNKRALDIRLKLFGEENSSTAESYHSLGITQRAQGDFSSALHSTHRALDIRLKLFGEENASTAESYHSLGLTQHAQGDFSSALQSRQRALRIRLNLFGEDHSSTADSYISLWMTQHKLGDFSSALQSAQRALDIMRKRFGEEHSRTAESYLSLGITQLAQDNFASALQSAQLALTIRLKLFGEKHSGTADSYHFLGITQHALRDFSAALLSKQRATGIMLKLFGEEHSSTADCYHSLSVTQHALGDFSLALQSSQRALDIRLKLIGEEQSSTADSYHSLGVTQHALGDFSLARQSKQRALNIRLKLFGEENSRTAFCYHSLGVTQHALGDFSSALLSKRCALNIKLKLFGEEHSSTADSYHALGVTQLVLGEVSSARLSKRCARNIRLKLFGGHPSTITSYRSLRRIQHKPDGIGHTASPSSSNDSKADSDKTIESATGQRDGIEDTASPSFSNDIKADSDRTIESAKEQREADSDRKIESATGQRDTIGDTASPSSSNDTEADSDRTIESATGQRVDDERVIWNAAIKFESEHDECVRVLPYFKNNDVEIHLYVYCNRSSGIPSELKHAAQASFEHMGWKLIWADLYNDAVKLLKVTSIKYSSGEPKRLDASQVNQIDEIINENLHVFSNHRNVTAVQPSFKVKNSVETEMACITVYVLGKGQIPMGEFAFPRTIGSYPVDIVNGFFVRTKDPYPTREAHKQDDVLRFGTSIGIKGKQSSGTLGAIVKDVNSGTLYALSCDHVMNDAVESEIIHPGLDVYLNYLHHNLNECKAYIQRIPRPPVELPPISDDILQDPAELQKKFSELKTAKAEYSASTGYSKGSLKNSTRCQETLEEAFAKEPRVIAKYLVGVRGNVGSEKNNGKKYFIDAAIAELKDTEVNNLRAEEEVEIIGTSHYPSGECASVTTDFEELEFFKSGSATGFTQRGVLVDSSYIKTSESVSDSIWTNVPCINCKKEAAESQVRGLPGPCEQCKGRNGWLERCLCIKQKGHNPFCDKGDSGAVVFGERRNAQTAYPGCGIIFGVFQCQYYIFALMSPLEIALEVLSRKVSERRPNNKPCKLQLVSTYNPN